MPVRPWMPLSPRVARVARASVTVPLVAVVASVLVLVGVAPAPAFAAPRRMCALSDQRLAEVSGVVTTSTGYIVVNDGGDELRLFVLDRACKVDRVIRDAGLNPFDPEDLGRERDGTLWIADIGDNDRERTSIAVHRLTPGASRAQLLRMTYPDGAHDAEAMVVQADGRVVIVTKEALGPAGVYRSTAAPRVGRTVALTRVGMLTIEPTGTEGGPPGLGRVAQRAVTGAAISRDRKRVVVRTYTDAYEWDVTADVAGAIVGRKPRRTPLPAEQQGESIAYTMDGAAFVTVSEGATSAVQRWVPARPSASSLATRAPGAAPDEPATASGLSLRQLTLLVVGIGLLGLVLVVAGVVGIVRFRREHQQELQREGGGRRGGGGRRSAAGPRSASGRASADGPHSAAGLRSATGQAGVDRPRSAASPRSATRPRGTGGHGERATPEPPPIGLGPVDLREPGVGPQPAQAGARRPRRPDEETISLVPVVDGDPRSVDGVDPAGRLARPARDRDAGGPDERDARHRPPGLGQPSARTVLPESPRPEPPRRGTAHPDGPTFPRDG